MTVDLKYTRDLSVRGRGRGRRGGGGDVQDEPKSGCGAVAIGWLLPARFHQFEWRHTGGTSAALRYKHALIIIRDHYTIVR